MLIPGMKMFDRVAHLGVENIVIGMAPRGLSAVLTLALMWHLLRSSDAVETNSLSNFAVRMCRTSCSWGRSPHLAVADTSLDTASRSSSEHSRCALTSAARSTMRLQYPSSMRRTSSHRAEPPAAMHPRHLYTTRPCHLCW
jgi:hypothetical protein